MLNCELWVDPKKHAAYLEVLVVFTESFGNLVLRPLIDEEYRAIDGGEFRGLKQICRENYVMTTDVFHLCSLLPNIDNGDGSVASILRKKLLITPSQYNRLDGSNIISLVTAFTVKLRASLSAQWTGVVQQWQQEQRVTSYQILAHANAIKNRCVELGYSPSFFTELVPGKVRALVDKDVGRLAVAISLKDSIRVDVAATTKRCSILREAAVFLVQKLSPSRCPEELISDLFSTRSDTFTGATAAVVDLFDTTAVLNTEVDLDKTTTLNVTTSTTRLIQMSDLRQPTLQFAERRGVHG